MTTIACSHCGTKYKVDPTRFSSLTPKIRCKKCDKVFEADLREATAAASPAPSVAAPAPVPAPQPAARPAAATATPVASGGGVNVLFAHESASIRERIAQVSREGGLNCKAVDNGVDALVELQSGRYQVGVLDVALPRMFGFEVCEVIRRDANLNGVKLLLIAAIYDQNRYRRPPSTLYGADGYIEKQDLDVQFVQAVRAAIQGGSEPVAPVATAPAAAPVPTPVAAPAPQVTPAPVPPAAAPEPVAKPAAPAQPVAVPSAPASPAAPAPAAASLAGVDPKELERARRLGRVIVSDLALYNKDIFATAQTPDEIYNALQKDIQDSREQINAKVSATIREAEDVLDIAIRGYIEKRNAKK